MIFRDITYKTLHVQKISHRQQTRTGRISRLYNKLIRWPPLRPALDPRFLGSLLKCACKRVKVKTEYVTNFFIGNINLPFITTTVACTFLTLRAVSAQVALMTISELWIDAYHTDLTLRTIPEQL